MAHVYADIAQWLVRRLPKPDTRVRFPLSAFYLSSMPVTDKTMMIAIFEGCQRTPDRQDHRGEQDNEKKDIIVDARSCSDACIRGMRLEG